MKRAIRIILITLVVLIVIALTYVSVTFPPVMAGMAAKTVCSCVYVTGRTLESVREKELQVFPGLSSMNIVLTEDSTVSASLLWHTSKAIYRKGLGCTLLAERTEEEIRQQKIALPSPPAVDQDTIAWPSGNLVNDSAVVPGVDYNAVAEAVTEAFNDVDPEKPVFTHAVVVVYDGKIVAERYAKGFDHSSRLMGWSMTKSITNALMGILVKDGKLKIDAPAPVAEWQNDERKSITINNLMQASSGLAWSESYFLPSSEFHRMFIHSDDKAAYAASLPLEKEPGTSFEYSSGTTNILSRMIRQTVSDENYYRFPYERLFYKIGMNHAIMEPDASGTFVASSYCFASARDWARFGMLFLNDGVWNGERILPEGWINYSTTPAPAAPKREYGAQVWLNLGDPNDSSKVEYPGLPSEAIIFDGFERNFVVIVPSKKLVVVRLGVTHNKNFSLANLVNGAIAALP